MDVLRVVRCVTISIGRGDPVERMHPAIPFVRAAMARGRPDGVDHGSRVKGAYQSATHSRALPIISYNPHGFGGYEPTGAVYS